MKIRYEGGLLYVTAELVYRSRKITLTDVILDTGSAGTLFSIDEVSNLGLVLDPSDLLRWVRGVGGSEVVLSKRLDSVAVGELRRSNFVVQIGAMDYGFPIQGLIGADFLTETGAVLDLNRLEIYDGSSLP